jgi:peptide/nickel transport system permease protein
VLIFIVRRTLQAIPTLFGVSLIAFVLLKAVPGDPARIIAGKNATPQFLSAKREALHLDEPYWRQYTRFVGGAVHLDFGDSWRVQPFTPVMDVIRSKFPRTVALALSAIIIEIIFGISLGVFSALMHRTLIDSVVTVFNLAIYSLPVFVTGFLLLIIFAIPHGSFDTSGFFEFPTENPPNFIGAFNPDFWLRNLLLPSISLASISIASTALVMRTSLLEVIRADYMKTARAKGLAPARVIGKHALKNAMLPVITVIGIDLGFLLGGAVITESVFQWDGLGRLTLQGIGARDAPITIVVVMLLAIIFVFVNMAVDILYAFLNPRIRLADVE